MHCTSWSSPKGHLLFFRNKGTNSDGDQFVIAFKTFQQQSRVSVLPMTAISSLFSMHEDICNSSKRKMVAMIILPFHKHQRVDGMSETIQTEYQLVNKRVLGQAPCSVGILVDCGLGGATHISSSNVDSVVTVLFFGGHDDHEALAYGARMAEHTGVSLTAVRFLLGPEVSSEIVAAEMNTNDEHFLTEFKNKISNNSSISYEERVVRNSTETIEAIGEFSRCNLFVVGQMPKSQTTAKMNAKTECPELGPTGSLLISPELSTSASVLVVQQFKTTKQSPSASVSSTKVAELAEEYVESPNTFTSIISHI
ncbi:putative Plasma membrane [Hibiscus syriacus]|uniref:Plasma membrane n=1 Tax=Hibiscus syriacus TaxID=106335 RepID=A0A6A3ATY2_HIBSY|nr:putative Plasma membrane [Hibiscus syriacus]